MPSPTDDTARTRSQVYVYEDGFMFACEGLAAPRTERFTATLLFATSDQGLDIEVGDGRVDRAGERIDDPGFETPAAEVAHPAHFSLRVSKLSDDEVEPAVGVTGEIGGAYVGDAGNAVDDHALREAAVVLVLEEHHGSDQVVAR